MKKWLIVAVLALAIAGGVFAMKMRSNAEAASASDVPEYTQAAVTRGPIREEVSCSGFAK